MTECNEQSWLFQELGSRKVEADFGGGYLSSDGGGLILREFEYHSGLLRDLAGCFVDYRDPCYIEHSVQELVSQRIYGLILGYEDLNDHDHLRRDPVHGLICGKGDPLGQDRVMERDKGKALAAHSTLNRLELSAQSIDPRYNKIQVQPDEVEESLIKRAVKAIPRKSAEIVLDFDATDDPLHGSQEGGYFNGYYRHYCYLPLYCFCGNIPFLAKLRDCKRDASEGTVEALQKIVPAIRKRFGRKVRIIVRADSGFAREAIMSWCEDNKVFYCFGLARNDRLSEVLNGNFESLKAQIIGGKLQSPCRSFTEFEYSTLSSWSKKRRVIGKAEVLPKGDNPRFIVTNLPKDGWGDPAQAVRFEPAALYEKFYCARGDMENRIKEQQLDLFADRTSTHWMASNQLRLWFSVFAHLIMSTLQAEVLKGTELATASIGQVRLRLFKIAARLKVSVRRIHIELCSAYPLQRLFSLVHKRLGRLIAAT
ncbi:MAG TPA: IS1380 family transposase [Candidatus Acidoferrum sp.]|nr:IS1380 family transposase [Candidatus Acidoferrum sp.]